MAPTDVSEIKLEDIDFPVVKECTDKHVLKKYIKLLEEDGAYFVDLLKACKEKLLEVSPKEYYILYPRVASDQEVQDAMADLLDWEASVKETDKALRNSKKDRIFDEERKAGPAIRGQEPTVARPSLTAPTHEDRRPAPKPDSRDAYARDKTKMKDYYSSWDKVDVDAMEEDMERQEREEEEAKRKHFEDLKEEQDEAQATTPIEVASASPEAVPAAHRKHMADSEKEKGNEAFYSKDWEEAEAYYSRSINFKADDPSTWANRALVRLKLNRPEQALEDCEHSLALNDRYMKALHRKGKALHELRRYEEAVKYFQLALAESPGNTQINGDLCVARRHLRSAPPEEPPKPRRVDAAPSCTIEELPDEEGGGAAAPSGPPPAEPGYTRVQIEEDSEDEDEDVGASAPPVANGGSGGSKVGFRKVAIEEVSGSEDEEEAPATGAAPVGAAAGTFSPPPRVAPAAPQKPPAAPQKPPTPQAAAPAAAQTEAVSFDDMD